MAESERPTNGTAAQLDAIFASLDVPQYEIDLIRFNLERLIGACSGEFDAWPTQFETYQQTVKALARVHSTCWLVGRRPPQLQADDDPLGFLIENKHFLETLIAEDELRRLSPATLAVH